MIVQKQLNFKVETTGRNVTGFAGLSLVDLTAHKLGVPVDLDRTVTLKERQRGYGTSAAVLDLASMMIAGGGCLDDLRMLRSDRAYKRLTGRTSVMAPTTAGEMLRRFDEGSLMSLRTVNRRIVRQVARRQKLTEATIDVDATLIEADKKEAKKSYKGLRGYMPLVAFWAEAGLALADRFRPGNASPGADALSFLKQCVGALPPEVKEIRFRSDSAWYIAELLDYCEDKGYHFTITADMDEAVREVIARIPEDAWKPLPPKDRAETEDPEGDEDPFEEYAETVHTLNQSCYAYRLVVLRKPRRQLDLLEGRYIYYAIITNWDDQKWATIEVVRWHRKRCNVENHIKELKLGLGLETLPCGQFLANAAYFRIGILAYNLVAALKVFALPRGWHHFTLKSLRFRLLRLAGLVVNHARRLILKLPYDYLYHDTFCQAHLRLAYG